MQRQGLDLEEERASSRADVFTLFLRYPDAAGGNAGGEAGLAL